tara:strand:- start:75 stop:683 length:609 start_codon:yes stop_codon:yes gene_type:complete
MDNKKIRERTEEEIDLRKKVLLELLELLNKKKIFSFIWGGVLLGFIRDKNFIKWDWDVEIGFYSKDLKKNWSIILKLMEENNFTVDYFNFEELKINVSKYTSKETTTFSLMGWRYDLFTGNYIRNKLNVPKKYFEKMEKIKLFGAEFFCPSPVTEYLSYIYGNWKVPLKTVNKNEYLSSKNLRKNNWFLYCKIDKFLFNLFN